MGCGGVVSSLIDLSDSVITIIIYFVNKSIGVSHHSRHIASATHTRIHPLPPWLEKICINAPQFNHLLVSLTQATTGAALSLSVVLIIAIALPAKSWRTDFLGSSIAGYILTLFDGLFARPLIMRQVSTLRKKVTCIHIYVTFRWIWTFFWLNWAGHLCLHTYTLHTYIHIVKVSERFGNLFIILNWLELKSLFFRDLTFCDWGKQKQSGQHVTDKKLNLWTCLS